MMSWTLAVMCELYRRDYLEIYDRRFWVKELNPKVQEIRRTLLDLKTTTRKETSFINTVLGRLAKGVSSRCHSSEPAAQWVFTNWTATCFLGLASQGCGDFLAIRIQSRFNNHYHKEWELGRVQIAELTRQAFSGDLRPALWSNPGWRLGPLSCWATVCS
jgi:hypothetical protein